MTYLISTNGPDATQSVAASLAAKLHGGETIELRSDLGGGKTTFVQGLAAALGYTGPVTSPTFTLSQNYPLPNGAQLHHYDLYRLSDPGVVGQLLSEDVSDRRSITVIEWAGIAAAHLPTDRIIIEFMPTGDNVRNLTVSATGPNSQLIVESLS